MYRSLFNFVKRRIPKISDTEMIALKSGDTSVDRNILTGTYCYPQTFCKNVNVFSEKTINRAGIFSIRN